MCISKGKYWKCSGPCLSMFGVSASMEILQTLLALVPWCNLCLWPLILSLHISRSILAISSLCSQIKVVTESHGSMRDWRLRIYTLEFSARPFLQVVKVLWMAVLPGRYWLPKLSSSSNLLSLLSVQVFKETKQNSAWS